MKLNKLIPLVLMVCMLAGCMQAVTDEDAFSAVNMGDRQPQQVSSSETAQPPADGSGGADASTPETDVDEPESGGDADSSQVVYIDQVPISETHVEDDVVPLTSSPAAVSAILTPTAAGTAVKTGGGAEIDYSNVQDGYVMVRFPKSSSKRLRVQVIGPATTYTYDLPTGSWSTFALSDGNGDYKVTALQNTTGKKYAVLASASFQVTLKDEFAPFLRPNQYVNYENAPNTIAKAKELTQNISSPLDKVGAVYNYVVGSLSYDNAKAATVRSGYLPDLDNVLASNKGICFDYAALMAGMLRSQGIPCKLVVGYAGNVYHAWVSVWTEQTGWIDGVIFFDGTVWQRMDPTFASSGNSSEAIMEYIGDGKNYTVKYLY